MELQTFLFWIVAALTGLSAIAVVVTQNIVRAAAWLLFTLAGTAGVFFLLGADFVGATQLIVYVGGILVLVVFGVMLTAQGPFVTMKTSAAEWAIAGFVGLLLYSVLAVSTLLADWKLPAAPIAADEATSPTSATLGEAFLGIDKATPDAKLTGIDTQRSRRRLSYLLPFEIISVHLLVVLIGAAYLARAKRRRGEVAP
jgi:NADH:ubiquinone oxidoreductase subunit 6 (subunit J)